MIGNTAPRRWRLAVDLLALLTAISLLVSSWALFTRFSESNRVRRENAQIWHQVICDIERQVVLQHYPVSRKRFVIRFYNRLLVKDAHALPCDVKVTGR